MKVKPKEIVGFSFDVIPLEEARTMVLAGDGNYSDLKAELLTALPRLPEGKAFSFGLPGKTEVPEDQRRGICHALNLTLKHAGLEWRVTYTNVKRLFLVVPKESPKRNGYATKSKYNDPSIEANILRLRKEGVSAKNIADELKVPIGAVHYAIYQKNKKPTKPVLVETKTPDIQDLEMHKLIRTAAKLWKVTPGEIVSEKPETAVRPMRKAIQYVAVDQLRLNAKNVGAAFGKTHHSINFNLRNMTDNDKSAVIELKSALSQ